MLPKIHRLHSDADIKNLVRSGQTFFLPQLVIKFKVNREKTSKVAFVVSTKVDKRAVLRNKLARRMREIVQSLLPDMKVGYSVLIIAKKQALELDFLTLKKQILFAFAKTKILANHKNTNASKNK